MNLLDLFEFKMKTVLVNGLFGFSEIEEAYNFSIRGENQPDLIVLTPDLYLRLEEQIQLPPTLKYENSDGEIFQIKQRATRFRRGHFLITPVIPIREIWFLHSNDKKDDSLNIRLKFLGKIYKND